MKQAPRLLYVLFSNASLQASCNTLIARATGCMWPHEGFGPVVPLGDITRVNRTNTQRRSASYNHSLMIRIGEVSFLPLANFVYILVGPYAVRYHSGEEAWGGGHNQRFRAAYIDIILVSLRVPPGNGAVGRQSP